MAYIAILSVTDAGRVAKYQDFPTKTEADNHAAAFSDTHPDAFVVEEPPEPYSHWMFKDKSVTIEVPQETVPEESAVILALRDLADDQGGKSVAKMTARFGPRPLPANT